MTGGPYDPPVMPDRRICLCLVWLSVLPATGCLGPRQGNLQSSETLGMTEPSPEADRTWEAAQDTLRRYRFRLDRIDRRAGIITTMPETSQSLVEFWRHDVDTWPDLVEATLGPIRRWVEVTFKGTEQGTSVELAVVVHKERLSSPDRQFNRTGAVYQFFRGDLPSTTGAVRITPDEDIWLDLGRDPAMEAHLLDAILTRAGQGATANDSGERDSARRPSADRSRG